MLHPSAREFARKIYRTLGCLSRTAARRRDKHRRFRTTLSPLSPAVRTSIAELQPRLLSAGSCCLQATRYGGCVPGLGKLEYSLQCYHRGAIKVPTRNLRRPEAADERSGGYTVSMLPLLKELPSKTSSRNSTLSWLGTDQH
ncbi:hypothetical protein K466DRAFT_207795 [Polyporus arcularius HHB13444]|uniref:Uncharacterized protein n=1 Tax=Polyporus arcularius HHB13444 TaxID=1314778 RepID=A0A5C3P8Q1_9APHY|nr:hypothetical protein K466DRAFT_207795 [Polyporus arcularius HHB13444]